MSVAIVGLPVVSSAQVRRALAKPGFDSPALGGIKRYPAVFARSAPGWGADHSIEDVRGPCALTDALAGQRAEVKANAGFLIRKRAMAPVDDATHETITADCDRVVQGGMRSALRLACAYSGKATSPRRLNKHTTMRSRTRR